jgi:hypothetical protein
MAYARIEEGFWTDPKIRSLPLEGKMVAAWLFTNPHRHFSGLYYLPIVLIPHEIGLSIGVSTEMLNLLEEQGFIKYSHGFSVVWVVTMLKHQSGGKRLSPQQVAGIQKQLSSLHGCPLIREFIERYQTLGMFYDGKIDTPTDTPIDTKSQSQSKSKSKKEDIAPPGPSDAVGAVKIFSGFFACKYFEVDHEYRLKLAREYPAVDDALLRKELSKAEDWLSDNAQKKKFKANGQLANPKLFIKNWIDKLTGISGPGKNEPKGFAGLRESIQRRQNAQ